MFQARGLACPFIISPRKPCTLDQYSRLQSTRPGAPERVATFPLNLSERFGQRGLSTQEFYLSMARQDIANYLGITLETASRTFRQLHDDGLIAVERRYVCIRDRARLEVLAKIRTGPSSSQAT